MNQESSYPKPVVDEFLQAFIVTNKDQSFYVDLRGNYSKDFKHIQWSNIVNRVEVAAPYIIGFLQDYSIEFRNILNPNTIYQTMEMGAC